MATKRSYPRTQNFLLLLLLEGDIAFALGALMVSFWVRFKTPLNHLGNVQLTPPRLDDYLTIYLTGTLLLIASFAYLKVYDSRLLLRPLQAFSLILKATLFWFLIFLSVTLIFKLEPQISRIYVAIAFLTLLLFIGSWRLLFHTVLTRSRFRERIVQRVALIGWTADAARLFRAIHDDKRQPYEVVGYVETKSHYQDDTAKGCPNLGQLAELEKITARNPIDIIIVCDFDLRTKELLDLTTLCERLYIQFKIIPTFFRIFVSSLHLQTVSGVPVLGIEELRVTSIGNALLKRGVDIFGALVGLTLSAPVMLVLALMIKRESKGPIFYKQVRTGLHGQPFHIYKLRSMKTNAEVASGAKWAVENDPRRTKIGAFMRETNLDEIPQFWNVLCGDMSLVGPRPERPELIEKFEKEIPHYNPRHEVRPGITGWAQVNGLRGNTSLVERIRYDLYYIENWSLLFDFQILIQTFTKNKNAY